MSFYDKSGSSASAGDHRRKWDATEYQIKANERIAAEREAMEAKNNKDKMKGPKVKRELLQARDEKLNLSSNIGKQVTINKTTSVEESGGFYCDICECSLKDSTNYLDHINGKNHQRKMGFSMKVRRSTVDDVMNKFAAKKVEMQKKVKSSASKDEDDTMREEMAKMADLRRQHEEAQNKRKRKKQRHDSEEEGELEEEGDDEMAKMMGFGGFSTSKKPK